MLEAFSLFLPSSFTTLGKQHKRRECENNSNDKKRLNSGFNYFSGIKFSASKFSDLIQLVNGSEAEFMKITI